MGCIHNVILCIIEMNEFMVLHYEYYPVPCFDDQNAAKEAENSHY